MHKAIIRAAQRQCSERQHLARANDSNEEFEIMEDLRIMNKPTADKDLFNEDGSYKTLQGGGMLIASGADGYGCSIIDENTMEPYDSFKPYDSGIEFRGADGKPTPDSEYKIRGAINDGYYQYDITGPLCYAPYDNSMEAKPTTVTEDRVERVEWLPIESAPMDGTRVLIILEECNQERWVDIAKYGKERPIGCHTNWQNGYGQGYSWNPTHWMPLPKPPAMEVGE